MRTSSVKSIAFALTIAIALTLAAPAADARVTRQPRASRGEAIMRTIVNLLKRIGQVTANGGVSIPQSPDTEATPVPESIPTTNGTGQ